MYEQWSQTRSNTLPCILRTQVRSPPYLSIQLHMLQLIRGRFQHTVGPGNSGMSPRLAHQELGSLVLHFCGRTNSGFHHFRDGKGQPKALPCILRTQVRSPQNQSIRHGMLQPIRGGLQDTVGPGNSGMSPRLAHLGLGSLISQVRVMTVVTSILDSTLLHPVLRPSVETQS